MGLDGLLRTVCIFCGRKHTGEIYDDLHNQMMQCRERASARKRGEFEAYTEWELDRPARPAVIPPTS